MTTIVLKNDDDANDNADDDADDDYDDDDDHADHDDNDDDDNEDDVADIDDDDDHTHSDDDDDEDNDNMEEDDDYDNRCWKWWWWGGGGRSREICSLMKKPRSQQLVLATLKLVSVRTAILFFFNTCLLPSRLSSLTQILTMETRGTSIPCMP